MHYLDFEKNFFGRSDIQDLLKRRIVNLKEGYRQNVALLGNKHVGKSSILRHFLLNFDDENVVMIYLDLEDKDFSYFVHKFTGSLLYHFSKSKQLPLHEDINLLLESTKGFIPQTVQVIKKVQSDLARGKTADCFSGLLALPEVFTKETNQFCVLVFDEFQNLGEFSIPNVFANLGKKIMTQKKCFYLVSSSYPAKAKKILLEKLSLLFGNFEVLSVEPFDLESSQQFIGHNLKEIKVGVQLRNFLTDFTGGHPLYLNLICRELTNLSAIYKQAEIYLPLLSQAIENTIFDRWGVISRHFEIIVGQLCHGKGDQINSSILMSLANGKHKMDEIMEDIGIKKTQLTQKINRLLDVNVIVKNGNFYYFKDKLLKYWIRYVYQKRIKSVDLTPDRQKRQFKEELNRSFENFKTVSREEFSSRVVDLLHCFDNEAFLLNGRRYKLPLFQEVVPFRFKNDNGFYFDMIKARTAEAVWFIVLKKDSFGENDVGCILQEARKMERKMDRCLIISLSELDENTRVKALQERFWIWSEKELNVLLTLFDKPYILR